MNPHHDRLLKTAHRYAERLRGRPNALGLALYGSLAVTEKVTVPGGQHAVRRIPLRVTAADGQDRVYTVRDAKVEEVKITLIGDFKRIPEPEEPTTAAIEAEAEVAAVEEV